VAEYEKRDPDHGPPERYYFLRCSRCSGPILACQTDYGQGWEEPHKLYPAENIGVDPLLPEPIRGAYVEALTCFRAQAYTASALMCRKTLEGVCVEHEGTGGNLKAKLASLKERGIIEARLFEWADALRLAGNDAAHDVRVSFSWEDARDIIEFTSALLDYLFTFRARFDEFKRRRASGG